MGFPTEKQEVKQFLLTCGANSTFAYYPKETGKLSEEQNNALEDYYDYVADLMGNPVEKYREDYFICRAKIEENATNSTPINALLYLVALEGGLHPSLSEFPELTKLKPTLTKKLIGLRTLPNKRDRAVVVSRLRELSMAQDTLENCTLFYNHLAVKYLQDGSAVLRRVAK